MCSGNNSSTNLYILKMKEITILCIEGDELLRDEMIAYLNEQYSDIAVIIPGVTKRPRK